MHDCSRAPCLPHPPASPGTRPWSPWSPTVGLTDMPAGGTEARNTDPYSTKGPHLMIAGADAALYDAYAKSADPDTSAPYVMWAGRPYRYLMIPVKKAPPAA